MRKEPSGFDERLEHIDRIQIPDSDLLNWMRELRNSALTEEAINDILMYLNKTYREEKIPPTAKKKAEMIKQQFAERGIFIDAEQYVDLVHKLEKRLRRKYGGPEREE